MKKSIIIETLQSTLEWVMQEWINTKQELAGVRIELEWHKKRSKIQFEEISTITIELEETQEALRRSRKLFESSKEIIDRQLLLIKRLERWITNTWYVADSLEVIKELPGWIEEDMIEYKLFDRDQGKYALLLK